MQMQFDPSTYLTWGCDILDLTLKFLELFKGFRLVLHQVNIPISTQVISKGHEVTKTIACGDVHGSTYICMYDPQQVIHMLHYSIEWIPCHFSHETWFTCIKGNPMNQEVHIYGAS